MRPTPAQIKEAQEAALLLLAGEFVAKPSEVIKTLLAATEAPTDEEIAEAAVQGYCHPDNRFDDYDREALCGVKDAMPHGSVYVFAACFALGIRAFLGTPEAP